MIVALVKADRRTAEQILAKRGWNVENAIEYYYVNRHMFPDPKPATPSSSDFAKLDKIFDKYVGKENRDVTSDEGLLTFFQDISVDVAGVDTLIISHLMKAETFGSLSREEFKKGLGSLWAFTLSEIKKKLKQEVKSIQRDDNKFSKFSAWLFDYVKTGDQKKTIAKDFAIQL